jgi:hypothetical protein
MVKYLLLFCVITCSHVALAQISQEQLLGRWQARMVIGEDGDSSLNFSNIQKLRDEMVKETLGQMTASGMSYTTEDSLALVDDMNSELMTIFETTYQFKQMDVLVLKTFQERDLSKPVSMVGQYHLDESTGKLVMTVNNSPATLMIKSISHSAMTAKDEAGNLIVFERIE